MVLSIKGRIFLFELVFLKGDKYTDLMKHTFSKMFAETSVPHHNAVGNVIEQCRATGFVADVEKWTAAKTERPEAAEYFGRYHKKSVKINT